jgi:hypothetical protein
MPHVTYASALLHPALAEREVTVEGLSADMKNHTVQNSESAPATRNGSKVIDGWYWPIGRAGCGAYAFAP